MMGMARDPATKVIRTTKITGTILIALMEMASNTNNNDHRNKVSGPETQLCLHYFCYYASYRCCSHQKVLGPKTNTTLCACPTAAPSLYAELA